MIARMPPVGPPIFDLESPLPMPGPQTDWVHSNSPRAIQHHLGRKLQTVYAALPTEPLPDALAALLSRLDAAHDRQVIGSDVPID